MPTGPPRRQIHGYVSNEARDGWYHFAEAHDTNVTALLEAIGQVFAGSQGTAAADPPPWLRRLVADAQLIASRRSSRVRDIQSTR